jgi:hypothetical protein
MPYSDDEINKRFAQLEQRIVDLERSTLITTPANKLPLLQRFDNEHLNRLFKLRLDLFHNQPGKQGQSEWNAKLFAWLDHKDGKSGHIRPMVFGCKVYPDGIAGCLRWKTPGTITINDHIISIGTGSAPVLTIGATDITLDEQDTRLSTEENAPVGRWYWNR